jgi:cysteine desulfurase
MKNIYLDYAAATPLDPRVLKAMLPFLKGEFANPSSIHAAGVRSRQAIDQARSSVAKFIGARPGEIVFTSGATESINLAILGAARAHTSAGRHIVSVTTEHKAALRALELEGFEVTLVPVDARGQIDAQAVLDAVRPDTILVSVMLANNEIGTIAPVADIGRGLLKRAVLFHTDAAQANGVIPIDVEKLHVDLMTLSAAKMYGPKGVGAVYVRAGTKLRQIMAGGNHEFGLRPGTENVAGIVGFGVAADIALAKLDENARHLAGVREAFVTTLLKHCKNARVNGDAESTVPHIVNVTFLRPPSSEGGIRGVGIDGEEVVIHLDAAGIACSTAAACKSSDFPSHVLRAIGLRDAEVKSTVRFSFGRPTTIAQARKAARVVAKTVAQLSR